MRKEKRQGLVALPFNVDLRIILLEKTFRY